MVEINGIKTVDYVEVCPTAWRLGYAVGKNRMTTLRRIAEMALREEADFESITTKKIK